MSDVVRAWYDGKVDYEWDRLETPFRHFEFASTLYLIDTYFPPKGCILDIGSGPGRYSISLLKKGYGVTLFELSLNLLDYARLKIEESGLTATEFINDDARNLGRIPSDSFDGILLMGPMYHLTDGNDRKKVLGECHRILRSGGMIIVAYINAWGLLRSGLTEFVDDFNDIDDMRRLLGEYSQSGDDAEGFTEAYFTIPAAALAEVEWAGFEIVSRAGVESFAAGQKYAVQEIKNTKPEIYENIKRMVVETCELEQFRDITEHLHIVARKKG